MCFFVCENKYHIMADSLRRLIITASRSVMPYLKQQSGSPKCNAGQKSSYAAAGRVSERYLSGSHSFSIRRDKYAGQNNDIFGARGS